jgi:hypothetical protein
LQSTAGTTILRMTSEILIHRSGVSFGLISAGCWCVPPI